MIRVSRSLLLLTLLACSACGAEATPPPQTQAHAKKPKARHDDLHGVRASSEIGGMNEDEVDKTFKGTLGSLEKCLNRGTTRVEFLGGAVSFFIKVNSGGAVEEAYFEHSTLGDRETEKCMLSVVRNKHWPKPVGGEHGLARKSFDFDPPTDVRPPLDWDPDRIKTVLKKLNDKLTDCRDGHSGTFEATAYVSADGSVMAASVTPPNQAGEAAVDCLIDTIRTANFPSPGSYPAKVTFPL